MTAAGQTYLVVDAEDAGAANGGAVALVPKKNLHTGEAGFSKHFKNITTLEQDVLGIASAVYAADVLSERGDREDAPRLRGDRTTVDFGAGGGPMMPPHGAAKESAYMLSGGTKNPLLKGAVLGMLNLWWWT